MKLKHNLGNRPSLFEDKYGNNPEEQKAFEDYINDTEKHLNTLANDLRKIAEIWGDISAIGDLIHAILGTKQ